VSESNPKVIAVRPSSGSGDGQMWDRLESEGWLAVGDRAPRVVIQVGQATRSTAVVATARSLAARLARVNPGLRIEVLDQAASADDWGALPVRRLITEDSLRVTALTVPQLVLPRLWFESFVLVTVTGVRPSPACRIASVFDAQAEPLAQLGNAGVATALLYEGHRLAASDLAVVCCPAGPQLGAAGVYWAASTSDTALEQAILEAAGIVPSAAPHYRELLRHEIRPPAPRLEGDLPPLHGFAAPPWHARREVLQSTLRSSSHVLAQDMRNLRGNLHKIPAFVRRRVATWRAQRSAS
jgi:hypothetical protein